MKLIKVNDLWLDEPLYCTDEFANNAVTASSLSAIDGSEIVFLQENKAKTLNFSANDISWNSKAILKALINLANQGDESEISLMTDEGSKAVRFDYTSGSAVSGEPLWVGSDLFYIELKFKLL